MTVGLRINDFPFWERERNDGPLMRHVEMVANYKAREREKRRNILGEARGAPVYTSGSDGNGNRWVSVRG